MNRPGPARHDVDQRLVLLASQKATPHDLGGKLADALAPLGWRLDYLDGVDGLTAGDTLLVLGLGNWARAAGQDFLLAARERGVRRLFWNFEPLLPPDLPRSRLLDWLLRTEGVDYTARPRFLRRVVERLAFSVLASQGRALPWNAGGHFIGHRYSFPVREARRLLGFWRDGLFDEILVSLRPRQAFLARYGVPSRFVPVGYHPSWGRALAGQERHIDAVFLGKRSARRQGLLDRMERILAGAGFRFLVVDRDCYGEERTRLLNRCKVLVNLHNSPWESPGMRLLMAMSCRAMVVSEWAPDTSPFLDGVHMVQAAADDLPERVIACLRDDPLRERVVEQAYRFVMDVNTLENRFRPVLDNSTGTV
ncbi:MAG: glycosyltransferase family 1 protein [Thiobacillus sp.]|nr:glycosyltransferase family 1 protein [Thiobacillus sp.]